MSEASNAKKMKMMLLIDKNSNKVVYAEAGKDCVDFLLHVFLMPLGTAMRKLYDGTTISHSLGNLYGSVEGLSTDYLQSDSNTKSRLLNPEAFKELYSCPYRCAVSPFVSDGGGATCPKCKIAMTGRPQFVAPPNSDTVSGEGYVKDRVTYMITDDLVVKPLSSKSAIALLNQHKVKDVGCIEEAEVTIDTTKGMELLKASLVSKTVLTDTFLATNITSSQCLASMVEWT